MAKIFTVTNWANWLHYGTTFKWRDNWLWLQTL